MNTNKPKSNLNNLSEQKKGRKKESGGVIATLERLIGKPISKKIRDSANKYLRTELFIDNPKAKLSISQKLSKPNAETLLMNALELDQVLQGDTQSVVQIISKQLNSEKLSVLINEAEVEIQRRHNIYAFWLQRMSALKSVLESDSINLKTDRLDQKINTYQPQLTLTSPTPYALRAVQQLEEIEERGRLGKPSADEYADQADAYMALGDYAKADMKAQQATDIDPHHAHAWFIRVMGVLKQRNKAINEMQHHQMIATEIADPLSGQEAWAHEMENHEGIKASDLQRKLCEILPQALLHWPKTNNKHDYPEQRMIVRDLFIEQAFSMITRNNHEMNRQYLYAINGLGPEWQLINKDNDFATFMIDQGKKNLPFSDDEVEIIKRLANEYDKHSHDFFKAYDRAFVTKSFKLLHLEWILNIETYENHWKNWAQTIQGYNSIRFEESILRYDYLAKLWQMHQMNHGGSAVVSEVLDQWRNQTQSDTENKTNFLLLKRQNDLFEYHLARDEFDNCQSVAKQAQQLTGGKNTNNYTQIQMMDAQYGIPIQSALYWEYLEILAFVEKAKSGLTLNDSEVIALLEMEKNTLRFEKVELCFWRSEETFDEGGGFDLDVPPYGVDLTNKHIWFDAINNQIKLSAHNSNTLKLNNRAESLQHFIQEQSSGMPPVE